MTEVNRGNSNITAYVWGFHKKMKPQIHQAIKANLPFLGKEKGMESGTSEGKEIFHRKMKRSKCLENKCFQGHTGTMEHQEEF